MSAKFPSIWLEIDQEKQKNILVCGFYREWTREGSNSEHDQSIRLKILCDQMEMASKEQKCILMLGDANLCAHQWDNEE